MPDLTEIVYTPEPVLRRPRQLIVGMAHDLIASRGLAWRLFVRDISAMYRQSAFGYAWAFIPPLVTAASFTFLNSQGVINAGRTSVPYPAFVIIGTLLWQTFVDALNSPLKSLGAAKSMLAKINFPREALLLSGLAEVLFNFCVRALLLVAVFIYYHLPLGGGLLVFPLALSGVLLTGFALGMLLAPLGLLYSDVGRGLGIITTFWMLLSPVVYPPPPTGLGAWLATWNPLSPLLQFSREALTSEPLLHLAPAGAVMAGTLILLAVAWILHRLSMPILIERMGG